MAAFVIADWRIDARKLVDQGSTLGSTRSSKTAVAKQNRFWADIENYGIPATDLSNVPRARPEGGVLIYAWDIEPGGEQALVSFDASAPGTYITRVVLSGLDTDDDEYIGGMDFRPADGMLYAVATKGFSPFLRDRLVTININTGVVTSVHPTNSFPSIIDPFLGIDFDPIADRLRNVGSSRSNRRLNPNDGTLVVNDAALAYVAGDPNAGMTPDVVHTAYTMSTTGPQVTTLYGIDSATNSLVRIGGPDGDPSPNTGQLTTIGALGVDTFSFGAMDIQQGTGAAYAALNLSGVATLVTINLTTGAATIIGPIGQAEPDTHRIDGLSLPLVPIGIPSPTPTPNPTPTPTPSPTPTPTRVISIVSVATLPGEVANVPIDLVALGDESSITFTINFNPALLSDPVVTLGSGVPPGSTLVTDVSQSAAGRIGISVISNGSYSQGTRRIVNIAFGTVPGSPIVFTPITFGNSPVPQSVTNLAGVQLPVTYQGGNVAIGFTAAGVEISGRVLSADGRGLRNAVVSITDSGGVRRTATTGSFGHYRFEDVDSGKTYVIGVSSKRYGFASRVLNIVDTLTDVDFYGN